jgi:cytochrome b6-f complex iron-sulfur subunit
MDRRTFLTWAGLGAIASSLPVALVACGAGDQAVTPTAPDSAGSPAVADFVAVGTMSQLDNGGSISDEAFAGGSAKLVVFKDGETVVALNAACPHEGCIAAWDGSKLVCPCHGAEFAADGSLLKGPAKTGLIALETKVEGDQVMVKA